MKALSLLEPWASLIACGSKRIETRSWKTAYRGPLAIHASKSIPKWARMLCPLFAKILGIKQYHGSWLYYLEQGIGPLGKIVATCNLVDCIEMTPENIAKVGNPERDFGVYAPGRYMWILQDIKRLKEPIPAKGQLRLWEFTEVVKDAHQQTTTTPMGK